MDNTGVRSCGSVCNMRFHFKTPTLGRLCNCRDNLVSEFGEAAARIIGRRLYLLHVANSLADVPAEPPDLRRKEKGRLSKLYSVDACEAGKIFFEIIGNIVKDDNGLKSVREIVIVGIGEEI